MQLSTTDILVDYAHTNPERAASIIRYLKTLNDARQTRLYRYIYNRICSSGGALFGLDWPTTRITHPELAFVLAALNLLP